MFKLLSGMDFRHALAKLFLLLLLFAAGSNSARADLKCTNDFISTLFTIGVDTPPVVVTPSTPIGTSVFKRTFPFTVRCSLTKVIGDTEMPYFKRLNGTNVLGNGLSVYTTFKGDRGKTVKSIGTGKIITNRAASIQLASSFWEPVDLEVEIEIVKDAELSGAVSVPDLLARIFRVEAALTNGAYAEYQLEGARSISFKPQTCNVAGPASFSVPLIPVTANKSKGFGSAIGSTAAPKQFALNLNCDVQTSGAFKVMMQLDGTTVSGFNSMGVLALNETSPPKSTGTGIQILHANSETPVSFGTPWEIGSYPMASSRLTIPFIARYYQVDDAITSGPAHATMTYTISYM